MPRGGKREGCGRKNGSRDFMTRYEVQGLRPRLYALAERLLAEAEALPAGNTGKIALIFKEVAPYVFKKQPQAVDVTSNGKGISTAVQWHFADTRDAGLAEQPESVN